MIARSVETFGMTSSTPFTLFKLWFSFNGGDEEGRWPRTSGELVLVTGDCPAGSWEGGNPASFELTWPLWAVAGGKRASLSGAQLEWHSAN